MPEQPRETLEETLRRLKAERDEADRRYNEALTALDRPLAADLAYPEPPPAYDESQITPLNEAWNILPAPPARAGWARRLTAFVWNTVAPYLQRQLSFNSRLVDHLNRNVAVHRESARAAESTLAAMRQQMALLAGYQSQLLLFLQQITGYVDTKDRDAAGATLVLNASLSAMAGEMAKRWESMKAREQRYEARTAALAAEHADVRALAATAHQASLTVKREVEKLFAAGAQDAQPVQPVHGREAFTTPLDAYKYVGFEDQFRGSRDAIRSRLESYLVYFGARPAGRADSGAADPAVNGVVLDVGCGRGEFLDLLKSHGIAARGIDRNHEMAEECRARGLDVIEADAVGYLAGLDDESLSGIFAAQVVEHLEPAYLLRFLELAHHKVRPGGRIVLETLNPACWVAFFESYIRDITHVWPLHPETLKYLVLASGFSAAAIEFRSPVPPQDRLQAVAAPSGADTAFADLVETFNANIEKINSRMFTHLDYAIVAQR